MVFDLSKRASFEKLDKWYEVILSSCDRTKMVISLIGNKCDLPGREVSYEEAMAYAQDKKLNYIEVSAKTGQNIANAFQTIVTEIYKQINGETASVKPRQPGISIVDPKSKDKSKKKGCCGK